jgi:hypothetical protein
MMGEWKYLYSEPFKCRYALAAYLLRDCEYIFEIGGYKTPIDEFVTHEAKMVMSIDPRIEESAQLGKTSHRIKARWPDVEFPKVDNFGLVVLGLELHLTNEDWGKFYELVKKSKRTILGVVPDHVHSLNQYNQIVNETGVRKAMEVTLDLSQNDFGDLTNSAPPKTTRRIVVLDGL